MVRRLAWSGGLYVSRYPPPETLAFHLKQLTRRLEINCVLLRKPKGPVAA
jgi:hypothetical protein